MSEGKRTPGPFQLEAMGCVYRHDRFELRLSDTLDNAECDEIVDLLNKGTHYDGMLEALRTAKQAMESAILSSGPDEGPRHGFDPNHPAMRQITAAIAKAEPTARE